MSGMVWVAVAIAGGIGSAARYGADAWLRSSGRLPAPWSTVAINVVGSFLLGLAGTASDHWWLQVVSLGVLGGFTTFSTISVETVMLLREHRYAAALATSLGLLLVAVGAAAAGWWLAATLSW